MSLERFSCSRRSLGGEFSGLLVAVESSGFILSCCSKQFVLSCQEAVQSDSEESWGEGVKGLFQTKSWRISSSSESEGAGSRRTSSSSTTSEEGVCRPPGPLLSNHEKEPQAMTLTLAGKSVRFPPQYEIEYCSEEIRGQQYAVVSGPYSESILQSLREAFKGGKVEYWGSKFRLTMPSSPVSEIDPITALIDSWQKRDSGRTPLQAFGSSALFDVAGTIETAGERIRVAPDVSITTEDRYLEEFAPKRFTTFIPKNFLPETCIEIRSDGNPDGELEKKAYVMLASGAEEVIVVDGRKGSVTQVWKLGHEETSELLKEEFATEASSTVNISAFGELLSELERPLGLDTSTQIVTVTISNPRLLRSRQWTDLSLDFTPIKLKAVYWLPTAKLLELTEEGLQIEKVGNRVNLVPRTPGSGQEDLPKLLSEAPDPEYSFDDIVWAKDVKVPKSMATRCTSAIRAGDPFQLLEGVIHLDTLNLSDQDGHVPLVEAVKAGNNAAVELLLREGADPQFADRFGMTAVIAASVLKRTTILELLDAPLPEEEGIVSALVRSDDMFDLVLIEAGLVIEDLNLVMHAAVKARNQPVVAALMEKGVNPNAVFTMEETSAIEYLLRDSSKQVEKSKSLVTYLLQKQVEYNRSEVEQVAKRRRRDEWLS